MLGILAVTTVADAKMSKGKVILYRIGRVKNAQGRGDLLRHAPISGFSAGQTQITADTADVRIDRNNQLGGRNAAPQAKINAVGRAHHPAQEHAETFAGAA